MEGGWYTSHSPSSVGGLCRVGRVLQTYRLVFNRSATLVGYRCSTAAAAALWRRARGIPASRLAATHRARRRVGGGGISKLRAHASPQSAAHHVVKKLPAGGCTAVGCGIGRWGRRARLRTNLRITPRLAAASDSGGQFFFFALKSRRFVSLAARWTAPSASRRPWLTLRTTTTNLRSRFLRSHRFAYLRNKRNDIFTNEK